MRRALHELRIVGLETSREFHLRVMEHDDYRRGDVSIQWLEQHLPELVARPAPAADVRFIAVAAALMADRDRGVTRTTARPESRGTSHDGDRWRAAARRDVLR